MGFGISPVDGGAFISQPEALKPVSTQDMIAQFNDGAKVIDSEIQAMSKDMMGVKNKPEGAKTNTTQKTDVPPGAVIPMVEEELSAELSKEQLVDRTRRKKSKWETKMDDLARLEGEVGFEQLEGEERSIFSQFFDNMARIKTLRAKLKQLEKQEDLLEEEKRRQKLEEQNEERRKRLREMQSGKSGE
jgi:hypothetical protein